MKTSNLIPRRLANLALAVTLTFFSIGAPSGRAQAPAEKISGPHQHENLAVYLIHGEDKVKGKAYLTLQDAIAKKKVVVRETGKVSELVIENKSDDADIYIQAGDIVKGGNQDRTLGTDVILAPKSKMPIAAFCVERGRWQKRGKESNTQFTTASDHVASKELKLAVKQKKAQGEVWDKVAEAQSKLSRNVNAPVASRESASSLQLTLENKDVKASADAYVSALSKTVDGQADVIGFAFAVNGKVSSVDVYGSHALFEKMWPKMLKAAAVEATADQVKGQTFEAPAIAQVEEAIADAEKGEAKEEKVTPRVKTITKESKANVVFETKDNDATVHRNYVVK